MPTNIKITQLANFECAAGYCPDNCCHSWRVTVDNNTEIKWQQNEKSQYLLDYLQTETTKSVAVKFIAKQEDGNCSCIDENGLCLIQANFGHDYLPDICQEYPRHSMKNEIKSVSSLLLSCPEVVKLTLLGKNTTPLFEGAENTATNESLVNMQPFLIASSALDNMVQSVQANQKIRINVQLYYIAERITALYHLLDTGAFTPASLKQLFKDTKNELYQLNLAYKQKRLRLDPVATGYFWQTVINSYLSYMKKENHVDITGSDFIKRFSQINNMNDQPTEIYGLVEEYRNKAGSTVQSKYQQLFRRYLELSFMNRGFPWNPNNDNHVLSFYYALLPFCLIQLCLWVRHVESGKLDDDDVVRAIYSMERLCGHDDDIYQVIADKTDLLDISKYLSAFLTSF